jgi:hypothetical protein
LWRPEKLARLRQAIAALQVKALRRLGALAASQIASCASPVFFPRQVNLDFAGQPFRVESPRQLDARSLNVGQDGKLAVRFFEQGPAIDPWLFIGRAAHPCSSAFRVERGEADSF